jgi:hypothetical protein
MAAAGTASAFLPALRSDAGWRGGSGHGPFGIKSFWPGTGRMRGAPGTRLQGYFNSGGPSGRALPPVPAAAALKNR